MRTQPWQLNESYTVLPELFISPLILFPYFIISEVTENNYPRANAVEEQIDKMYLDILKKKISVGPSLLPQDDKTNKVSFYNLH